MKESITRDFWYMKGLKSCCFTHYWKPLKPRWPVKITHERFTWWTVHNQTNPTNCFTVKVSSACSTCITWSVRHRTHCPIRVSKTVLSAVTFTSTIHTSSLKARIRTQCTIRAKDTTGGMWWRNGMIRDVRRESLSRALTITRRDTLCMWSWISRPTLNRTRILMAWRIVLSLNSPTSRNSKRKDAKLATCLDKKAWKIRSLQ